MSSISVRKAEKGDCSSILTLIKELAIYERALDEVSNTVEQLERDGFGTHPLFECLIAEKDNNVVGLSLWYYRYSTWKGKRLYMEDIIVSESQRRKGVGKLLFDRTIELAKENGCTGLTWQVLDWNQPAIDFYEKYDAHFDEEWTMCNLSF